MDSNNKLNTIVKYKLLIIIGLFVVAVLNGTRQTAPDQQDDPVYEEFFSHSNSDLIDQSAAYNEIYPRNFLELQD